MCVISRSILVQNIFTSSEKRNNCSIYQYSFISIQFIYTASLYKSLFYSHKRLIHNIRSVQSPIQLIRATQCLRITKLNKVNVKYHWIKLLFLHMVECSLLSRQCRIIPTFSQTNQSPFLKWFLTNKSIPNVDRDLFNLIFTPNDNRSIYMLRTRKITWHLFPF